MPLSLISRTARAFNAAARHILPAIRIYWDESGAVRGDI